MPRLTLAAAMPWPITPAPTTPADAIFRGFDVGLTTPASFLLRSVQEEHVEQRPVDRRAEQLGELFGLHLAGRLDIDAGRTEHDFQRRQRRRVVALGLLLDVGARRRAEEAELGFADLDRAGPALAVAAELAATSARRESCGSRRPAARSPVAADTSTTSFASPIDGGRAGVDRSRRR